MATELTVIETYLRSLITATSGITDYVGSRVYAYKPPQDATYPCIVYDFLAGEDTDGLGTVRLITEPRYQVRVIDHHPISSDGIAAWSALDNLLQAVSAASSGGHIISIRRDTPVSFIKSDVTLNKDFRYLGGIFKITCA